MAYLVQDGGSDWRTAQVMDLNSGEVLDDKLEWLKYTGLSWVSDGSGFYYSRYPAATDADKFQSLTMNHSVYFHRIGDAQADDELGVRATRLSGMGADCQCHRRRQVPRHHHLDGHGRSLPDRLHGSRRCCTRRR